MIDFILCVVWVGLVCIWVLALVFLFSDWFLDREISRQARLLEAYKGVYRGRK